MSSAEKIADQILSSGVPWSDDTIRALCVENTLLVSEVRELLEQQNTGDQILETLRANFGRRDVREFEPGEFVEDYELLRKIGQGGFGDVWLAQSKSHKQRVVVKIANSVRDVFEFEVTALRRVNAIDGVAKILDHGTFEERAFLVMEFISGPTLSEHLEKLAEEDSRSIPVNQRLEWIRQLVDTVAAIHSVSAPNSADAQESQENSPVGLAHGDITPSNILIQDGQPVLIDFGGAFEHRIEVADETKTTSRQIPSRPLCFTPDYRVPEVMYGVGVTSAADVYQIGLIAFELLAGEKYTVACNQGREEVGFERVRATVGSAYEQIVRKCLRWNPGERYSQAIELRHAIRFPPRSIWRKPSVWVCLIVALGATIAWGSGWLGGWSKPPDPTPVAESSDPDPPIQSFENWSDDPKRNFEEILLPQWWEMLDYDLSEIYAGSIFSEQKELEFLQFVQTCEHWIEIHPDGWPRLQREIRTTRDWSKRMLKPLDLAIAFDKKRFEESGDHVEIVKNGEVIERVLLSGIAEQPVVSFQAMIYDTITVRLIQGDQFVVDDHFVYLMAFNVGRKPNGLRFRFENDEGAVFVSGVLISEGRLPPVVLPTRGGPGPPNNPRPHGF